MPHLITIAAIICMIPLTVVGQPIDSHTFKLKGIFVFDDTVRLSIHETKTNSSGWGEIGQTVLGINLKAYNHETNTAVVSISGTEHQLKLITLDTTNTQSERQIMTDFELLSAEAARKKHPTRIPAMEEPLLSLYNSSNPSIVVDLIRRGYSVPVEKIETALKKIEAQSNEAARTSIKQNTLPLVTTSMTIEEKITGGFKGYVN